MILPENYDSVTVSPMANNYQKFDFVYDEFKTISLESPNFGVDADAAWNSLKYSVNG
jgi:hypothetical protein